MGTGTIIVLAIIAVIAVGLYFGIRQKKAAEEERQKNLYKIHPLPKEFPVATQGGPKPRVVNAPVTPSGDPLTVDGDFVELGSAEDKVGDPVLARKVDIARSDFWILPEATLFKPGDAVTLRAKIVDVNSQPLQGVPVFFVNRAQRRQLGGHNRTNPNGFAEVPYTVVAADMIGNPDTPEPDTGSYLVDCYAGGRKLVRIRPLHDIA